ncbi:indolepyruvate ferredoxin oxidoreductase, subunit iorB [Desulfocicer vacuolatum DSM 3385]|uniref:Indolepyruvate ferredoxin oxidoreductase, subunit iorB n=1 Tax=Desulfocicer vacuolatum DSM 3385 TaxID=1121400 RepID=A0A1W1ZTT5_9BACT|nr:indolepyruvate oxidoreductase subunit beta [Desulfocicer vacuolatum]SMC51652.1 indolepyruvate ferredoxin oxidoreductase, subunit iorB [Desulfocicer vacuolatum DSM 3385]
METTRLIVVAVGGQGNLLASKVLGEAALLEDVPVRMSEIHGMAQRGGVVESAIVFGDAGSTIISDGEADILLGFEPSEVVRAMGRCNSRTRVITNTAPLRPFTVAIGQGVYPDVDGMMSQVRERVADLIAIDALALARQAGSPMTMNIVLLGALIASGALGLSRESVEKAIALRAKKAFVEMNLKAFRLGEGAVTTA